MDSTEQQNRKNLNHTGRLIEHGAAPFENDPKNKESYFVTLETDAGKEQTIWGVNLERAMEEGPVNIGDRIEIKWTGSEKVLLPNGTTAERNDWMVSPKPLSRKKTNHRNKGQTIHPDDKSKNPSRRSKTNAKRASIDPSKTKVTSQSPAQEERQALLENWKATREESIALIRAEFVDLAERHIEERKIESGKIEETRAEWLAQQTGPEEAFESLWALEKAKRLEPLGQRHQREREETIEQVGKPPTWTEWLRERDNETARQLLAEIELEQKAGRGNGIEGRSPEPLRPLSLEGIEGHWNKKHEQIEYQRNNNPVFTDTGQRIEVSGSQEMDIEAALRLAEQKFEPGAPLTLTGDDAFKDKTARVAAQLGIAIKNPELQKAWEEERDRLGLPLSLDPDIILRNTIRTAQEPVTITLTGPLARLAGSANNESVEWTLERTEWLTARTDLAQTDTTTRVILMQVGDKGPDSISDHERSLLKEAGFLDQDGQLNRRAMNTLAVKEELLASERPLEKDRELEQTRENQVHEKEEELEQEQKALRTRNVGEEDEELSQETPQQELDFGIPEIGVER